MNYSIIILLAVTSAAFGQSCQQCCPRPQCNGLYRVCLDHCGPEPCPAPPVTCSPTSAPAIEKPVVQLPACIPQTKILGATASCVKTYLKPQLYQQLVNVPIVSKYLQTLTKPICEVITFNAIPVCPPKCCQCAPPPCPCPPPCPTPACTPQCYSCSPPPCSTPAPQCYSCSPTPPTYYSSVPSACQSYSPQPPQTYYTPTPSASQSYSCPAPPSYTTPSPCGY